MLTSEHKPVVLTSFAFWFNGWVAAHIDIIDVQTMHAHRAWNVHNALNVAVLIIYQQFRPPGFSVDGLISLLHLRLISGKSGMIWASSIKILLSTCLKMFPLLLPRIAQVWAYYLAIRVGRHLHKGLTPQPLQLVRIQTFELNGWTIQPLIPWSPGSFTRLDSLWGNFWHPSCGRSRNTVSSHSAFKGVQRSLQTGQKTPKRHETLQNLPIL